MTLDLGLGIASPAVLQRHGEAVELPAAPCTMSQLAAGRIYQRATTSGGGQGKGQGTIAVALDVTEAGPVFARCRAADGSIVQSAWEAGETTGTGAQAVDIEGVDARLGWFHLDLRGPGTQWVLGTSLVGMGQLTAVAGQSLAVRMFGKMDGQATTLADLGIVPSANSAVHATYEDGQRSSGAAAWARPADGTDHDSSFAAEFLRLQVAATGVNCGLIGHSRGGESITVFVPGGGENSQLRAILDAAGGFEKFLWLQGHSDSANGMAGATYQGHLDDLFDDLADHNEVLGGAFDTVLATIPNIGNTSWGAATALDAIRSAAKAWAAANGQTFIDPRDIDLIDGIHQSQAGSVRLAHHYHRAVASSDAGPVITGGTRALNSADVVLSVDLPADASSLVAAGDPELRFDVYEAGDTSSPLALDTSNPITVGADAITLHLGAAPIGEDLDIWFCRSPDPGSDGQTDMVYDDYSDGLPLGRQLAATLVPVTVPHHGDEEEEEPSYTGLPIDFVGTPAFAAGLFGQAFSPGGSTYGTVGGSSSDGVPASNVWTLEARFRIASAPTDNVRIIVSGGGGKCWIGITTNGKLVMNAANVGGGDIYLLGTDPGGGGTMPNVADDAWHHVAMVVNGSTFEGFLDGVKLGTHSGAMLNGAGSGVMNIGNHGSGPWYVWPGLLDEIAVWSSARYTSNFTPPAAPYVGDEGMIRLWHLNGDGASSVIA